jgi:hypothetical protein
MLSINMLFAHRLQEFYTGGEREAMADEISNLRDQVEKESCMFLSSVSNKFYMFL